MLGKRKELTVTSDELAYIIVLFAVWASLSEQMRADSNVPSDLLKKEPVL